jgi:hypothetical protein
MLKQVNSEVVHAQCGVLTDVITVQRAPLIEYLVVFIHVFEKSCQFTLAKIINLFLKYFCVTSN